MVEKTSQDKDFCSNCVRSRDCKAVYQQVGDVTGPCIVVKVLIAFLLPLMVFIIALAVFENFLTRFISGENLRIILGLLLAAAISFICVLVTKEKKTSRPKAD